MDSDFAVKLISSFWLSDLLVLKCSGLPPRVHGYLNAEENEYEEGVVPEMKFVLTKEDVTETGAPATLLVFNNEVGFSRENMDSICGIFHSTKMEKRQQRLIEENGNFLLDFGMLITLCIYELELCHLINLCFLWLSNVSYRHFYNFWFRRFRCSFMHPSVLD
ncbi:hypothetical protein RchiOBHm_Chr6g0249321 [Rosa chinensis]|uniref:Uncharacterized protein n=1 Tax=Rosa chinensis TaxID=74649 RepID=A0A2P6PK97_ROSCH|nr:hypothetical protein RchiOBHm_Chr6g0249321 [Rosa chinensis]